MHINQCIVNSLSIYEVISLTRRLSVYIIAVSYIGERSEDVSLPSMAINLCSIYAWCVRLCVCIYVLSYVCALYAQSLGTDCPAQLRSEAEAVSPRDTYSSSTS